MLNGKITHTLTSSYKPIFKVFYIKQTKIHSPRNEAYDFVVQAFIAKREHVSFIPSCILFTPVLSYTFCAVYVFNPFFFSLLIRNLVSWCAPQLNLKQKFFTSCAANLPSHLQCPLLHRAHPDR